MIRRFKVMRRGYLDAVDPAPVATGVEWLTDGFVAVRWVVPRRATGLFESMADLNAVYGQTFEIGWVDFTSAAPAMLPDDAAVLPAGSHWEGHDDPLYPHGLAVTAGSRS